LLSDIAEAYKNKSSLFVFSVVLLVLGAVTMIWFQELTLASFSELMEKFETQKNTMLFTPVLNIFSGFGLLAAGVLWIIAVFDNRHAQYRYSYFDEDEGFKSKLVYALTGIILIGLSCIFFNYLFTKVGVLIALLIVVGLFMYGSGTKK